MSEFAQLLFPCCHAGGHPQRHQGLQLVSTLYKGSIELRAAPALPLTFIFLFCIGGLTGVMQGALPSTSTSTTPTSSWPLPLRDVRGTGFGFFSALLYWVSPRCTGRCTRRKAILRGLFPIFIGFNMLYFSMLVLGLQGHAPPLLRPPAPVHLGHVIATVGSWFLARACCSSSGPVRALFQGPEGRRQPLGRRDPGMDGRRPPPWRTFHDIPTVTTGPSLPPGGPPNDGTRPPRRLRRPPGHVALSWSRRCCSSAASSSPLLQRPDISGIHHAARSSRRPGRHNHPSCC